MPESRTFRTMALILKRSNHGEADRRLTLFTPQYGKIEAVAKGARKPASRKTGHVELFTRSDLLIARGRAADIITQADVEATYLQLRDDLTLSAYASYAAELLDRFTLRDDDIAASELFDLLDETFERLCTDTDPLRALRYYELHLLDAVGFRPELSECVIMREDIQPEDQFFSFDGGGVVSPAGATHSAGLVRLPMMTLKLLRHLQRSNYRQVAELTISDALHVDAERIMLGYITFLLERRLQSVDFINILRRF